MKQAVGKGSTYEAAVEDALKQLNATREQVEIEPIREASKGFLGIGRKLAEVRALLRGDNRVKAENYMKGILSRIGIDTQLEVNEENEEVFITLGEEASPLIGHRGQTLDALQYLVARYLNEDQDEWNKVVIDIDHYRDRREESLKSLAVKLANQVVKTKRDAKTEPLTAPERRIIHMVLKERKDISTFSIGEGNRKRVVIASAERNANRRRSRGGSRGRSNRPQGSGGNHNPRSQNNNRPRSNDNRNRPNSRRPHSSSSRSE